MVASREFGESWLRLLVIRINCSDWHRCQISRSVAVGASPMSSKRKRARPRSIQNSTQTSDCISRTRPSTGPWMWTSARIPFTIFLGHLSSLDFSKPGDSLFGRQAIRRFCEDAAPCLLRLDASLNELLGPAIPFDQLLVVLLHVVHHDIELLA